MGKLWNEEDVVSEVKPAKLWSEEDVVTEEPNSLGRQAGLTGRLLANIATSPAQLGGNFLNKVLNNANALAGGDPNYWAMPSEVIDRQLDKVTPTPRGKIEGITQSIGKSAPTMLLPGALLAQTTGNAATAYALADQGNEARDTAIGASLPVALRGLGVAGEALWDVGARFAGGPKKQVSEYLHDVLKGNTVKAAAALDDLAPIVKGEVPTAGLAAVSPHGILPQLKALEQQARAGTNTASEFAERDALNAAARLRSLDPMVAPAKRVPAGQGQRVNQSVGEAKRSAVTGPMYNQAEIDRVPITDELKALLDGPEAASAIAGGDKAFRQEVANIIGAGGTPPVGTSAKPPSMSIEQLQKISQRLRKDIDGIGGPDPTGRKARLIESRTTLENIMENASPAYKKARSTYRTMSEPVNQAAVGEQLVSALRNPSGLERPGTFLNALDNAPQTIKKSGAPRFQEIGQIATPQQMGVIDALRRSAIREQAYNTLDSSTKMVPGTTSPAEVVEGYLPPIFNQSITTIKKALRKAGGYSDRQAQELLDNAMLDPRALSQLIKMVPSESKRLQLLAPSSAMLAASLRDKEQENATQ